MVASSPALAASCHQSHVKVIRFHGDDKFAIYVIKVMCHQIYHCLGDDMVVIKRRDMIIITVIIFLMKSRLSEKVMGRKRYNYNIIYINMVYNI